MASVYRRIVCGAAAKAKDRWLFLGTLAALYAPGAASAQIAGVGGLDIPTMINNGITYFLTFAAPLAGLGLTAEGVMLIFHIGTFRTFVRVICGVLVTFAALLIVQKITGGAGGVGI
jgi:type IV secretory pathway VirB2 component (pilin)